MEEEITILRKITHRLGIHYLQRHIMADEYTTLLNVGEGIFINHSWLRLKGLLAFPSRSRGGLWSFLDGCRCFALGNSRYIAD